MVAWGISFTHHSAGREWDPSPDREEAGICSRDWEGEGGLKHDGGGDLQDGGARGFVAPSRKVVLADLRPPNKKGQQTGLQLQDRRTGKDWRKRE